MSRDITMNPDVTKPDVTQSVYDGRLFCGLLTSPLTGWSARHTPLDAIRSCLLHYIYRKYFGFGNCCKRIGDTIDVVPYFKISGCSVRTLRFLTF